MTIITTQKRMERTISEGRCKKNAHRSSAQFSSVESTTRRDQHKSDENQDRSTSQLFLSSCLAGPVSEMDDWIRLQDGRERVRIATRLLTDNE